MSEINCNNCAISDFKESLCKRCDKMKRIGSADDIEKLIIECLPSAQPEIIRCRDCKHWDKTWTNDWSPDYHYCPMIDGVRKGDFYCADAERRTDGTDARSDIG